MKNRLYIIEGLPCSGKSTISAFVASCLEQHGKVCFVDEGTRNHPADYEFHALAPAGLLSDLPVSSLVLDNPQENWERAREKIKGFIQGMILH